MLQGQCDPTLMVPRRRAGYEENRRLSFWLSFDPDAQTIKYGKGHHMEVCPAVPAPGMLKAYDSMP